MQMDYPTPGVYGEKSSSESSSNEDSENVQFRNDNEQLERPVHDNQSDAPVDDEMLVFQQKVHKQNSLNSLPQKR